MYPQLGDSNSQWHKKNFQKVPVGGSASWETGASWGTQIEPLDRRFIPNFVGGKNLTPFSASNDLESKKNS